MKNRKNTWRYYHFTHVNHKWQSYGVWFLRYKAWRTKFFVILDRFCLFIPLTTQKINILKKWKEHLEILSFYTSVSKIMIMCYTVSGIWPVTDKLLFFILGYFLPFYPLTAQKIKISKKLKQTPGDIIILHMCTKNYE